MHTSQGLRLRAKSGERKTERRDKNIHGTGAVSVYPERSTILAVIVHAGTRPKASHRTSTMSLFVRSFSQ